MIRFTHNGRPFDASRFAAEIEAKAIALGITANVVLQAAALADDIAYNAHEIKIAL